MTQTAIPDDLQRFILLTIPSVPYLEALLLMRSAPERHWDAADIAQRLYLNEKVCAALLTELTGAAIACPATQQAGRYSYQPQSEQLMAMIDRLADMYAKNLVGVSNLIHSKVSRKAQQFVDAFVLRKDH